MGTAEPWFFSWEDFYEDVYSDEGVERDSDQKVELISEELFLSAQKGGGWRGSVHSRAALMGENLTRSRSTEE